MRALVSLTRANLRSFSRDRAALFWTLAFPIVFVIMFGTIFAGGGDPSYNLGWVDLDVSPASAALRSGLADHAPVKLTDGTLDEARAAMKKGDLDGIIVIPKGMGAVAAQRGGQPLTVTVITDPSRSGTSSAVLQIANGLVSAANLELSGATPLLAVGVESLQTEQLNSVSFIVPSILAM